MKTPWVNSTNMQEIVSRQINIVNSSRVQIKPTSPYCDKSKDFTDIKIDCRLSNHIPSLCVSDESDEFNGETLPEITENSFDSPACIGIEQPSEIETEAKDHSAMNITEPTNDQQNFQTEGENYSPKDSAFDTNDSSDSNEADESDEFNGETLPEITEDSFDSPACIGIEQPSEIETEAKDHSAMNITEPTNDQQNFQTEGENYSPKDSAFDTNDSSDSNEADEK